MVQKAAIVRANGDAGAGRGRPAAKAEEKRREILRLAEGAFRELGFAGAGMREIAAAAGMRPGNLYYYFRGKDELLYFCQKQALTRLIEEARAVLAEPAPAAERLKRLVESHVRLLLEETGGSAANLEFRSLPPARRAEIATQRDRYERLLRGEIARGARDGSFRRVDPKLATLAILGAANGTVVWWRPDGPLRPAEIAASFADLLVGGLVA